MSQYVQANWMKVLQPKYTLRVIKRSLKFLVRNLTRGHVLGDQIDLADTSEKRRTGLLKHMGLKPGEGLWIVPCESVHCFFMKFTIDVLYIDRDKKVRGMRRRMNRQKNRV